MSRNYLNLFLSRLGSEIQFAAYIGLVVAATLLISRLLSSIFQAQASRKRIWLGAFLLNLAILGFFLVTIFDFWSPDIFALSPLTQKLFLSREAGISWFFVPLFLIFLLRFRKGFRI
jgi:hypothetical protein